MIAAHKGDMEAVVMLLEANADVTIKSSYVARCFNILFFLPEIHKLCCLLLCFSEGKTAADFAADKGHNSIAEILSVIVLSQQKAGQERPPASDVSAAESSFSALNVDGGSAAAGDQAQPPPPSFSSVTSDHTATASTTFSLEALQARAADTAGCDKTRLHEYFPPQSPLTTTTLFVLNMTLAKVPFPC
jgi:hypothetical protein